MVEQYESDDELMDLQLCLQKYFLDEPVDEIEIYEITDDEL